MLMIPSYISRIDFSEVQALQVRRIELNPTTGRMVLKFHDSRFPPMITCAKTLGLPCPNDWLVKTEDNDIELKSDLEFRAEYRIIN